MPSKILIVDDDTSVTEALSLILNRNGYEVSTAHDGERAWDALLNSGPDVVLLDYGNMDEQRTGPLFQTS